MPKKSQLSAKDLEKLRRRLEARRKEQRPTDAQVPERDE